MVRLARSRMMWIPRRKSTGPRSRSLKCFLSSDFTQAIFAPFLPAIVILRIPIFMRFRYFVGGQNQLQWLCKFCSHDYHLTLNPSKFPYLSRSQLPLPRPYCNAFGHITPPQFLVTVLERNPRYIHRPPATTHGVSPQIFVHICSLDSWLSVLAIIMEFDWVDAEIC